MVDTYENLKGEGGRKVQSIKPKCKVLNPRAIIPF